MNYHTCMHCGAEESYSTSAQCRNDVVSEMTQQGWDVYDNDGTDEWYCPDCLDQMPNNEMYSPPATVEYRGFTITFQKVFGDGDPRLRCQIREDEDFFQDFEYDTYDPVVIKEVTERFIHLAKNKIDILYMVMHSTLDKFQKMFIKQKRRQMIDPTLVMKISVFKTQMEIIDRYFPK